MYSSGTVCMSLCSSAVSAGDKHTSFCCSQTEAAVVSPLNSQSVILLCHTLSQSGIRFTSCNTHMALSPISSPDFNLIPSRILCPQEEFSQILVQHHINKSNNKNNWKGKGRNTSHWRKSYYRDPCAFCAFRLFILTWLRLYVFLCVFVYIYIIYIYTGASQ